VFSLFRGRRQRERGRGRERKRVQGVGIAAKITAVDRAARARAAQQRKERSDLKKKLARLLRAAERKRQAEGRAHARAVERKRQTALRAEKRSEKRVQAKQEQAKAHQTQRPRRNT